MENEQVDSRPRGNINSALIIDIFVAICRGLKQEQRDLVAAALRDRNHHLVDHLGHHLRDPFLDYAAMLEALAQVVLSDSDSDIEPHRQNLLALIQQLQQSVAPN